MRPIPNLTLSFVEKAEDCILRAYPDPATKGDPWTVGVGHTGPEVKRGMVITHAQAMVFLQRDLERAAQRLAGKVKADVIAELTDHQYAALLSFVFNLGTPGTGIWKALNGRRFDQVPVEMMRFVYAAGKKMKGLVTRRTEEVKLWSTDEPGSVNEDPPSSVTRLVDTPPASMADKPLVQSKTMWTAAAGAATAATAGVTQVQALVAPQAANSELLGRIVGFLAFALVALSVAVLVFKALDHRSQAH